MVEAIVQYLSTEEGTEHFVYIAALVAIVAIVRIMRTPPTQKQDPWQK